jgi:hypothetical protein
MLPCALLGMTWLRVFRANDCSFLAGGSRSDKSALREMEWKSFGEY